MNRIYTYSIWTLIILIFIIGLTNHISLSKNKIDVISVKQKKDKREKFGYDRPDGFYQYFNQISKTIDQSISDYPVNYSYYELQKALLKKPLLKATKAELPWVQRGPGNVGGRTRCVIVDPDDVTNNTWYAASVSGGVWKTTDAGVSWTDLTKNLGNLASNTLAMAGSNHNVIYIGTGEGYDGYGMVVGNGIFKTSDKGLSWNFIESTQNDNFRFVNKILVDPFDDNSIIAATNTGLFKSSDSGITWDTVYFTGRKVQDLVSNPGNFNTIYASVNGYGIIKSYDRGNTWQDTRTGLAMGHRFSLTVSPVDTNRVYTFVESPSGYAFVYISFDGAQNWRRMNDIHYEIISIFGGQGWFNNVIQSHPYKKNTVYIGGVNIAKVEFKNTIAAGNPQVLRVDTINTASYMDIVPTGLSNVGGLVSTGDEDEVEDLDEDDFTSVELRFGPGYRQKAYRFTVPEGEGAGVPPDDFSYNDYIDIPCEAWDMDNNRQLMICFRDNERDGEFNLIERVFDDEITAREYIYINAVEYSETADTNFTRDGGHMYKMLYMLWPVLAEDAEWNADSIPDSKIYIEYGNLLLQNADISILADRRRNKELHVDHHDLVMILTNPAENEFTILNANDGGLGISYDEGNTWKQIKDNYITTQFYGVAKKPGAHEYIGGMQDNGTWQSPVGETATSLSEFSDKIEGDGFEVLWHPWYPQRIIGSTYNNHFFVTNNEGEDWEYAAQGIYGDGPFISRLSHHIKNPNLIFTVGGRGVFKHFNFGLGKYDWELVRIRDGWSVENSVTSSHNVKVSLADSSIVWAGGGMYNNPDLHIFVSKDVGVTFDSVSNYPGAGKLGYISGLATHPYNPQTAYVLFSIPEKPKILRTINFGETWEDISGFDDNDSSSNGFPDVRVYSLLVMPYDTNIIWAGTEIGIFESLNNGLTWEYADNGLPAVSVWQMYIADHSIVVATHGRGIWSYELETVNIKNQKSVSTDLKVFPNPAYDHINILITDDYRGDILLEIYDMNGKKIKNRNIYKSADHLQENIDVSDILPGTYLVSLSYNNKRSVNKFLIK